MNLNYFFSFLYLCLIFNSFCNAYQKPKNRETPMSFVKTENPWINGMNRWNITQIHGEGTYVGLGGHTYIDGKPWSYFTWGKCPRYGYTLTLSNGVDFLQPISTSTQDSLSGGLGALIEGNKPVITENLMGCVKRANDIVMTNNSLPEASQADQQKNTKTCTNAANKKTYCYTVPLVYNLLTKQCYLLQSNLQMRSGSMACGGNSGAFCITPQKSLAMKHMVFGSANMDPNYEKNCPYYHVKDSNFGAWNTKTLKCESLINRPSVRVVKKSIQDCLIEVFDKSSSDQPADLTLGGLLPQTRVVSNGVGYNYGIYFPSNGTCYTFNTSPECFIEVPGAYSFTSLGSSDYTDSKPVDCTPETEGWKTLSNCELDPSQTCGFGTISTKLCKLNTWTNIDETSCIILCWWHWLIIALCIVFLIVAIVALIYYCKNKGKNKHSDSQNIYTKGQYAPEVDKPRKSEEKTNPDQSFWGTVAPTNVRYDSIVN